MRKNVEKVLGVYISVLYYVLGKKCRILYGLHMPSGANSWVCCKGKNKTKNKKTKKTE